MASAARQHHLTGCDWAVEPGGACNRNRGDNMPAMTGTEAELEHVRAQYGRAMDTVRTMTAELDALHGKLHAAREQLAAANAKIAAVPVEPIREAHHFCRIAFHPTANLDVMLGDWWAPLTEWLETEVTR